MGEAGAAERLVGSVEAAAAVCTTSDARAMPLAECASVRAQRGVGPGVGGAQPRVSMALSSPTGMAGMLGRDGRDVRSARASG